MKDSETGDECDETRYEPSPEERTRLPKGCELYWFIDYRNARAVTVTILSGADLRDITLTGHFGRLQLLRQPKCADLLPGVRCT